MPAGNITAAERFKRLHDIKILLEDGKNAVEISGDMGMSLEAVKRNIKYIEELNVSDLTPKEIASKRSELYIELSQASEISKGLLEREIEKDHDSLRTVDIRRFYDMWMQAIQLRMKLYGLDSVKVDNIIQFNTQVNQAVPDKVSMDVGNKIAEALISNHESKLRSNYEV